MSHTMTSDLPSGIFLRGVRKDLIYFRYQDPTGQWRNDAANLVLPPLGDPKREAVIELAKAARDEIIRTVERTRQVQKRGPMPGVNTVRSYAEKTWLKRRET